jgi:hypothetical protein
MPDEPQPMNDDNEPTTAAKIYVCNSHNFYSTVCGNHDVIYKTIVAEPEPLRVASFLH